VAEATPAALAGQSTGIPPAPLRRASATQPARE